MGKRIKEKATLMTKKSNVKQSKKKLILSVISLIITAAVFVSTCFCWYRMTQAETTASTFKLEAGKGLRVNDGGTNNIDMAKSAVLIPATSVDGRNLFFPADGNFSVKTKEIIYRSSNVGDRNVNYAQIDFTLSAVADYTAIYIDAEKTHIKVQNSEQRAAPIRVAIWAEPEEGEVPEKPVVFNSQAKTITTVVPKEVDRSTGEVFDSATQTAYEFSEYSHTTSNRIATINKNKEKKFSIIIWLEGSDSKCTTSRIALKDVDMEFAFTTSWDNTETIRFQDNSQGNWIQTYYDGGYTLELNYQDSTEAQGKISSFTMYKTNNDNEWSCQIPGDMKNKVWFVLRPPASATDASTYKFCISDGEDGGTAGTSNTYNRGVNRLYVVKNTAASNVNNCQGHWVALGDSDGAGHDGDEIIGDGDF